jgi:hypothetical protein
VGGSASTYKRQYPDEGFIKARKRGEKEGRGKKDGGGGRKREREM